MWLFETHSQTIEFMAERLWLADVKTALCKVRGGQWGGGQGPALQEGSHIGLAAAPAQDPKIQSYSQSLLTPSAVLLQRDLWQAW